MAENLLYLAPVDFNIVPADLPGLLSGLRQAGFIANELAFAGETHYCPGEEFLSLVTYLGCSPVIALGEPGATGEGFAHVSFEGPLDKPRFVGGTNLKTPRCPHCGHRFDEWQKLIEAWQQNTEQTELDCPDCGNHYDVSRLRWRKCAGFGRFFIKIWGIFESEAVPAPELVALLEKLGGCRWQHFYVRYTD